MYQSGSAGQGISLSVLLRGCRPECLKLESTAPRGRHAKQNAEQHEAPDRHGGSIRGDDGRSHGQGERGGCGASGIGDGDGNREAADRAGRSGDQPGRWVDGKSRRQAGGAVGADRTGRGNLIGKGGAGRDAGRERCAAEDRRRRQRIGSHVIDLGKGGQSGVDLRRGQGGDPAVGRKRAIEDHVLGHDADVDWTRIGQHDLAIDVVLEDARLPEDAVGMPLSVLIEYGHLS